MVKVRISSAVPTLQKDDSSHLSLSGCQRVVSPQSVWRTTTEDSAGYSWRAPPTASVCSYPSVRWGYTPSSPRGPEVTGGFGAGAPAGCPGCAGAPAGAAGPEPPSSAAGAAPGATGAEVAGSAVAGFAGSPRSACAARNCSTAASTV